MATTHRVRRIETDRSEGLELTAWPAMNPEDLVSGNPVQSGLLNDEDESTDFSVGVWECTAFVDKPGPYPVDEFMFLLEGTVEMVMPDGTQITVPPGEAFIIPKGLDCQWKMPDTVLKIFMILDGMHPGTADNPSLHRITVPDLTAPDRIRDSATRHRATHFVNHDGRMQVHVDSYASAQAGFAPPRDRHLIHVLSGSVAFPDNADLVFNAGDCFYLFPGDPLAWNIANDTRLLISSCDLPGA